MSERFRLLFRGEVLEGQHPAVVRRKLGQLLGLDDARLGRLFSGQPVIVKAETDSDTAARIEATFRKAGACLEREPLAASAAAPPRVLPADAHDDAARLAAAPVGGSFEPEVLPVGSDVLREDERAVWMVRDIDTAHLGLLAPDAQLPESPPPPAAPDTSKLSLLDP